MHTQAYSCEKKDKADYNIVYIFEHPIKTFPLAQCFSVKATSDDFCHKVWSSQVADGMR